MDSGKPYYPYGTFDIPSFSILAHLKNNLLYRRKNEGLRRIFPNGV